MGLFDFLNLQTPQMTPQNMGLLGAVAGIGNQFAPQPASRLPLARPNPMSMIGAAAGGFGQGYGAGVNQQHTLAQIPLINAQTQAAQLQNLNNVVTWNLWAPYLGQQPINLGGGTVTPQSGGAPQQPAPSMQLPTPGGASAPPTAPMAQPSAPTAPAVGGASPAPMPNPTAANMGSLYELPPPLLQRMGIQVPPELTAAYAAGIQPGTAQWKTLANNAALKAGGINPMFGGDRPGVPLQQNRLDANGNVTTSIIPGSLEAMTAGAMTQVPAKEAEAWAQQRARVAGEAAIAANTFRNQYGTEPPTSVGASQNQKMVGPSEPIITPSGSAVPAPPSRTGMGAKEIDSQIAATQKTEENWNAVRPSLEMTETRLKALGQAFQTVKSGGLTEQRAQAANTLRGLGMGGLADQVMTAKDTAAVQSALWLGMQDVLGTLKQINAGTGGRILNSEFEAFLSHGFSPNMDPTALHNAISQQLGSVQQTKSLIDDWYNVAKPGGWHDVNHYQSAYLADKRNGLDGYVKRAADEIGALKGMAETRTIAGKTYVKKDGQWYLSNQ